MGRLEWNHTQVGYLMIYVKIFYTFVLSVNITHIIPGVGFAAPEAGTFMKVVFLQHLFLVLVYNIAVIVFAYRNSISCT